MISKTLAIFSLSVLAAALGGCATSEPKAVPAPSARPSASRATPVVMTGTNGDMNRYVGTWISDCGKEFSVKPDGTGAFTSSVNSFRINSASGKTAQGTLTVDTFTSRDCTGPSTRAVEEILLTFVDNNRVIGPLGVPGGEFTGVADRVAASIVGRNDVNNELNIGFWDNFRRLQMSPLKYFTSGQLVYVKK